LSIYRALGRQWDDEYYSVSDEVILTSGLPTARVMAAFENEARIVIANDPAKADEYTGVALAAFTSEYRQEPGRRFDRVLGSRLVLDLTRHDPARGRRIWLCSLAEPDENISPAAGRALNLAIKEQQLPPDVLAEVVSGLAGLVYWLHIEMKDARAWLIRSAETWFR